MGVIIRHLIYSFLFKHIAGLSKIYAGVYFTHTYGISVGKNFSINSGALLDGRGAISIGDHVMIGPNVVIASSNHVIDDLSKPMAEINHRLEPINIGSDVWIGASAVIVGGVTIGNGAVIAAGSVVTSNIDDFKVAGGVPAKIIKDRREQ
jgi:maltose O-acetyltransferase